MGYSYVYYFKTKKKAVEAQQAIIGHYAVVGKIPETHVYKEVEGCYPKGNPYVVRDYGVPKEVKKKVKKKSFWKRILPI